MTIENKIAGIISKHYNDERVYVALHELAHAFRVLGRISNDFEILSSAEKLYKSIEAIDIVRRHLDNLDSKVEEID